MQTGGSQALKVSKLRLVHGLLCSWLQFAAAIAG